MCREIFENRQERGGEDGVLRSSSSCGVEAITPDSESGDRGFNPHQEL